MSYRLYESPGYRTCANSQPLCSRPYADDRQPAEGIRCAPNRASRSAPYAEWKNPNRLILVVDDFKDDRDRCADFLAQQGFRVEVAQDGEEALSKAATLRPDLIVMDLWMPGISGWEAIRRLKANAKTRDIPVVVLTARAFVSAEAVGVESCLIKPFDPEEMFVEINCLLLSAKAQGR